MILRRLDKDREKAKKLVTSSNFNHLILFLILFDSVILGFMYSSFVVESIGFELFILDRLIVALFISEMMIKLYAYQGKFFKSGWNLLDLTVVALSIVPATSYFVILRSLRLLRLVKYIDKDLKISAFMDTLISAIPLLATALISFGFLVYIFGIMAVGFFGDVFVEFSSVGASVFTLLQMIMLDGVGTSVVKSIMYVSPFAWIFFAVFMLLSYIIATTFVVMYVKQAVAKKK